MSEDGRVWIGADPGGKENFGVAVLQSDGSAYTRCVSSADEAIEVICDRMNGQQPAGAGVDAPLWWSSGISGGRYVDQWLRDTYHLSGGQVQSVNSLRGAVLAQGMLLVQWIREEFGVVPVTETHPKALLAALEISNGDDFRRHFSIQSNSVQETKHERDAVISAVAAREGFQGRWTKNLSVDLNRYPGEQDPSEFWLAPIHYYWPDSK